MHHGFSELCVPPTEHPLMIVEPPLAVGPQRERLAELMFETFRVPALYMAKSSVTAAFSAGLATATVVDLGAAHTRVTPVFEGYQLNHGVYQSPLGGDLLSDMAASRLEHLSGQPLRPLFQLDKRPTVDTGMPQDGARRWQSWEVTEKRLEDVRASLYHRAWRRIGQDLKESWAEVPSISLASETVRASAVERAGREGSGGSQDGTAEGDKAEKSAEDDGDERDDREDDNADDDADDDEEEEDDDDDGDSSDDSDAPEEVEYELPDGTSVVLGRDRRLLGELLVSPLQGRSLPLPSPFPSFVKEDHWRPSSARTVSRPPVTSTSPPGTATTGQVGAVIHDAMFGARGEPVGEGRSHMTYHAPVRSRYAHVSSRSGAAQGTFPVVSPLPKMVHGSLSAADSDVRGDLAHNVLLVGGGSLIPGLATRLQAELSGVIPSAFKPRVLTASPIERRFAPWIGGSIFSSLGTFQQLWVSRMEYEEEGAGIVERRCP